MVALDTGSLRLALDKKMDKTAAATQIWHYEQITAVVEEMLGPDPALTYELKKVIASLTTRVESVANNDCGSHCGVGEYVSQACTPTQKTVCTACPPGQRGDCS